MDTADDPRDFAHSLPGDSEGDAFPPGVDTFLRLSFYADQPFGNLPVL